MSLPEAIRSKITIPAFCAPMFLVSSPAMVKEACLAGLIAGLPAHNARSMEELENWLKVIYEARTKAGHEGQPTGVLAINLNSQSPTKVIQKQLSLCVKYGVEIIVNASGNPSKLTTLAHDLGLLLFADTINIKFAEKAIEAGVDGIIAIGSGGGGHSGTVSHLALVPKIREIFDGVIVMAGCVSNGANIRAAEVLGADLAYLGTRFIATKESAASEDYKSLLISQGAQDVIYTDKINGVSANWMKESMRLKGIDPNKLPSPEPSKKFGIEHLPKDVKPWINLWSAGQGIELINDIPSVAELAERLKQEYMAAIDVAPFKGFNS